MICDKFHSPQTVLSTDLSVLCRPSLDSHGHLFLDGNAATFLWSKLFGVHGELQVCPTLEQCLLVWFKGCHQKEAIIFWKW